ncbi:MAG: alpha-L-glutamate ligase-like protein [Gemmataceae bacterium]|nr:alpha-L-glutamate ligase-like protein [Gemmataceae bacterium]
MAFRRWLALISSTPAALGDVLSMNRRNIAFGLDVNPPERVALADDKLRCLELCSAQGIPSPKLLAVFKHHRELGSLPDRLSDAGDFVVKPNRGSGGRGVVLIVARHGSQFLRHDGRRWSLADLRLHIANILAGGHQSESQPDFALIQQRVRIHPALASLAVRGIPDVRVIVYRGVPVMAMLRLPTETSGGRANLHQGGIGAGVELDSGRLIHAVCREQSVVRHPETGTLLLGQKVPFWAEIRDLAVRAAACSGLGFVGVDVALDALEGPVVLEWNARPGLAIQLANRAGLLPRLRAVDAATRGLANDRQPRRREAA